MQDTSGGVMGRAAELAEVDGFLAAARREFTLISLEGEPGIGKTTVWREALRRAGGSGARVLVTRPNEAEAALSFAGLGDLFDPVADSVLGELPPPQQVALAAALLREPPPDRGIDERALCAAVLSVFRSMAAVGPVVVAVDDAHWLDSPSTRALSFAVRRLEAEPIGVLVTVRTSAAARLPAFDLAAEPARRRAVRLGPLTLAALHGLIKQRTQRSLPRPALVRLAVTCGGNPLHALEVAARMPEGPPSGQALPVPDTLAELVAARVGRLPPDTRDALLEVAALTQPSIRQVDRAALTPAEQEGIVTIEGGRIQFAHPLFAAAVYGQASAAQRRQVHQRLAEITGEPEERARHAALGAAQPDRAIARELDAAAMLAGSRGARDAAAELLELAVGLTAPDDAGARAARLVAAARCWYDAGDLVRSQATVERTLAEGAGGRTRALALQLLGQLHQRRSSFAQATDAALRALGASGDDPELRADIELDIAYDYAGLGNLPEAEAHARAAVAASEHAADAGALGDALAVLTMAEFLCGRGVDESRLGRARMLEQRDRVRAYQMSPSFIHGLLLMWSGNLAEALSILEGLHSEARERGEESPLPISCLYLTWCSLWRGDLRGAARFAEEARQTAAVLGDPGGEGSALTCSALVHAHDGSAALARQEALEAVHILQGIEWPTSTIWPLWALGLVELSAGNPGAVDAALGGPAEFVTGMETVDPVIGVFLPDEIEALVELGRLDRAEPLLTWWEERAAALDRPWALASAGRCRGLLSAARGDLDAAQAALDGALAQYRRLDIPFERARTLLTLGRVQRRSGSRARAGATLSEALGLFDELGAPLWAGRTRAELERLGRRAASSDDLSPTEARIADLAASGLTNQEIAERAFLTTKAVEANLTRVYRKLGIRSRGGLARALQGFSGDAHE